MKKVAVLLANGFEEIEALASVDILRRAEFVVDTVSMNDDLGVESARGVKIIADKGFTDMEAYDMVVLPGGKGAWLNRDDQRVIDLLVGYNQENKYIGAICAAPMAMGRAGIIGGKKVTSYPDDEVRSYLNQAYYLDQAVVVDGNIVTSQGPATSFEFAYTLVELLGGDAQSLRSEMLYKK